MTDVRRLLARLNPATIRYGAGRGGIPELTASDIAGALGMVRDKFAREVFCAVWWPDGARLTHREFDLDLRNRQMKEWMRRQRASVIARLAMDVAHDELKGTHGGAHEVRRTLAAARVEYEAAAAEAWPAWQNRHGKPREQSRYALIRAAVIVEIGSPRTCSICAGRGNLRAGALVVKCEACAGSGQRANSERHRAASLGIRGSSFEKWAPVYDWTYTLCKTAENTTADALGKHFGETQNVSFTA